MVKHAAEFLRMLSPRTQTNLANAKGYFEEHLCAGDYYAENSRVQGVWMGAGAALLGLEGHVMRETFLSLCENRHPGSGKRLTQRHKTTRIDKLLGGETTNRRVFFDFTISPPKSVSIAALVADDKRIVAAHRDAVNAAVAELETFAATRLRGRGEVGDRRTGSIVAALFEHKTSRALDPHLHTHRIVFKATHDEEDGRWKALQNHDMLAAQKYVENVYYHELARALRGFGYTVVTRCAVTLKSPKCRPAYASDFQNVTRRSTSRRRHYSKNVLSSTVPMYKQFASTWHTRSETGKYAAFRSRSFRPFWAAQLSVAERKALHPSTSSNAAPLHQESSGEAFDWAEAHLFERRSVVHEHELWRHGWPRRVAATSRSLN